ncbi:circadian locomoter output cycles protein kaput-like isoform X2 [Daktulosphaira vitifoliae]|uniref:circadian locomoter output cycles protein kaput-like isoform X2 n=1 Tax=Daktulosphaira vitifoliae TaxID=58002 RepID=UPI0021AAD0F7|nr:circadian locomoter output cycles protein kaput-like isoform X2 [Daktulosphaira vitifoliae]
MSSYIGNHSARKSEKSRNLSEKKRRDQFNSLINELNCMLSTNNRKMDKSTVLRTTINYLKNQKDIVLRSRVHEIDNEWKPPFLFNEEFTHIILEALDGFIIVFTSIGKILYASETVTALLGYLPKTLTNKSIFKVVNEADHPVIQHHIAESKHSYENKNNQVEFSCHCKRHNPFKNEDETNLFELVQFFGYFRNSNDILHGDSGIISSYSNDDDEQSLVFVGIGRIMTPQLLKELTVMEDIKSEFTSRHSLEWKFLFLDHRGPPIIGYMPFEVLGTSGYEYYHIDDLEDVILSHQALMLKGEETSCYYRFLTKGQQWIWLQSRYYISYHQWNSKPEFIVCHHRVINYLNVIKREGETEDGKKNCQKRLWHLPLNEHSQRLSKSTSGSYQRKHYEMQTTDLPKLKIRLVEDASSSNCEKSHMKVVETKQELPEQFNNYLQNTQNSMKVPSVTVSPLPENIIQDQLQRKQEQLQKTIVRQQEELRKVSEQLLMARCGILPSYIDGSLQLTASNARQLTQPETSVTQIICSSTNESFFDSSALMPPDVLMLNHRNEQNLESSFSSNIMQNMVDEGGGHLDYDFNQSSSVIYDQSSQSKQQ